VTSEDFKSWRKEMGLSQQAAADVLDMSKGSVELYERGSRRDDGREVIIPTTVHLSCKYLQQSQQRERLRNQQLERLRKHLAKCESGEWRTRGDEMVEWIEELKTWISDLEMESKEEKWQPPAK